MDFCIDCWQFNDAHPQQNLDFSNKTKLSQNCWYHCQRDISGLKEWLNENQIPPSMINSFLAEDTRPLFEQYSDDAFLLILRGINLNQDAKPENMLSLRFLYFHGALITSRKIPSKTVLSIQGRLLKGNGPTSLSELISQLIDGLNQNIDNYLVTIEDKMTEFDDLIELSEDMMQTHKALLKIKRFIQPQQYAIEDYSDAEHRLSGQKSLTLKHTTNTITRINETLDFYLRELELIKGELRQYHAEKLNKNTYLFSIIAAIFLPTSFLTGLLGVNVGGLPGTESPVAFTIFCCGLIIIFGFEIWVLRRLHFFGE